MLGDRGTGTKAVAVLLIVLMAAGSVLMWLGVPFLWIWGVSQAVETSQPTLGPYLVLLVGIPASMILVGKGLGRLNRIYGEVTGTAPKVHVTLPWHRSMRGDRDAGQPRTILDVVMVTSVGVALVLFGLWFLFLAEGGGI